MVTYHPAVPSLRATTKQYQPILHASERLKQAFPLPPLIPFRHPKNLRDLLVRATLTTTQHDVPGNYHWGSGRCKTCPILLTTNTFTGHTTGVCFKISIVASCKSCSVIYLITCRRCGQQYVGETGHPLHLRMNSYCHDITRKRIEDSPVTAHLNHGTHSLVNTTVMVIDLISSHDSCWGKIGESKWIRTLGTSFPSGMNLRVDSVWCLLPNAPPSATLCLRDCVTNLELCHHRRTVYM